MVKVISEPIRNVTRKEEDGDASSSSLDLRTTSRLSLKTRWAIWRARHSAVGLLARLDERKAVSLIAAIHGGLAILTIGFFAWMTDLPLMFPALGPTAFILFATPTAVSAAPRSVILGHFSGMASGWLVCHLVSTLAGGPVSVETGGWSVILSASLSLAITCGLLVRLSCVHPPACASSLVVALGAVADWRILLLMGLAVVWMTVQAVAVSRFTGVRVPTWSPVAATDAEPPL